MNLLYLLCLYQLSHVGNGRVHKPSGEAIRDVDKLGRLNWSVSGNVSSLDPFKCRVIYDK